MLDASLVPPPMFDPDEVALMLSVSKGTLWKLIEAQKIPKPIRLSSQCLRWKRDVIIQWIDAGCPPCNVEKGQAT